MRAWHSLPRSARVKVIGYAISTLSVVLLAIVSWRSASQDLVLAVCLLGGAIASIVGMMMRMYSYEVQKEEEAG